MSNSSSEPTSSWQQFKPFIFPAIFVVVLLTLLGFGIRETIKERRHDNEFSAPYREECRKRGMYLERFEINQDGTYKVWCRR